MIFLNHMKLLSETMRGSDCDDDDDDEVKESEELDGER